MALLDINFEWPVDDAGYERITVKPKPKRAKPKGYLYAPVHGTIGHGTPEPGVHIVPKGGKVRMHRSLEYHGKLFRDFAQLDGSIDSCLQFAGRFGLLSDPSGEPVKYWKRQIQAMRQSTVYWEEDPTALCIGDKGEVRVGELDVVLVPSETAGKLALRVKPRTLLAAMQLQLVATVAIGLDLKACKNCEKLFEIGPNARRTDAEHCSTTCRIAYNNAKKLRRIAR